MRTSLRRKRRGSHKYLTWIEIEDDEDIQNAEMEEEMKKLEQSSEEDEEDVEPEEDDPMQLEGNEKVDGGGGMRFPKYL